MADVVRILGLDDDNHPPCYCCEDGTVFNNAKEAMEFLAQPHECQYEVKMFAITDKWSVALSEYDEEIVNNMFDFLMGICVKPENMELNQIFNLFWGSTNRFWW